MAFIADRFREPDPVTPPSFAIGDPVLRTVIINGKPRNLRMREWQVFMILWKNRPEVVQREHLKAMLHHTAICAEGDLDNLLRVTMNTLRKRLEGAPIEITTDYAIGYRLLGGGVAAPQRYWVVRIEGHVKTLTSIHSTEAQAWRRAAKYARDHWHALYTLKGPGWIRLSLGEDQPADDMECALRFFGVSVLTTLNEHVEVEECVLED